MNTVCPNEHYTVKGLTVRVMSSDPPFKVSIACFTTVPLKALPDKVCKLSMFIMLYNNVV